MRSSGRRQGSEPHGVSVFWRAISIHHDNVSPKDNSEEVISGSPVIPPLDLSEEVLSRDQSGTPAALLELARQAGDLMLLDGIPEDRIQFEFPMGSIWQHQTGYSRFVRLRPPAERRYALVGRANAAGGASEAATDTG
jgi:hypothetical protein